MSFTGICVMDFEHLRWGLLHFILILISVGLHEFGHAWMADYRGDPLPRLQGRVTLNPFAHADLIGTILIPLLMIFLHPSWSLLGWGKPVQVALLNPRTRKMDDILITLAGPAMNLILCLTFVLIAGAMGVQPAIRAESASNPVGYFLLSAVALNVTLVAFNLLPLPPLDGSRIAFRLGLYSEELFATLSQWSWVIFIILINLPLFNELMETVIALLATPPIFLWGWMLNLHT